MTSIEDIISPQDLAVLRHLGKTRSGWVARREVLEYHGFGGDVEMLSELEDYLDNGDFS